MAMPYYNPARRPSPAAATQPPPPVGATVLILGLQSKPELNGALGTVLGPPVASTGRIPVEVGEEKLLLKPDNLERVENGGAATNDDADAASVDLSDMSAAEAELFAKAEPDAAAPSDERPLPALPSAPMWAPLVDSSFAWRGASSAKRGAVPINGEDEEEEFEEENGYDEEDELDARMAADAALLDAAVNGAPAGGGGFVQIAPKEWRTDGPLPAAEDGEDGDGAGSSSPYRFQAELCGGTVQECDVSTPAGLALAVDALKRRVPILMRNGAVALLGDAATHLGSAESIGKLIGDRDVSVAMPPRGQPCLHAASHASTRPAMPPRGHASHSVHRCLACAHSTHRVAQHRVALEGHSKPIALSPSAALHTLTACSLLATGECAVRACGRGWALYVLL